MTDVISTERLVLRPWTPDDAEAALAVFGDASVARWLTPAMSAPADVEQMREHLERWAAEQAGLETPRGRWAVERAADGVVVGGMELRPLPPYDEDIEIGWQLAPGHWGQGYATEAARAVAQYAFSEAVEEVFAVVRPSNERATAVARRLGMEWVGETDKYYGLVLQVYRLRPSDLAETPAA
ncbi:RimJ/RimL family protein N-acetyltransferase [Motilibacter rhizosphaerae]|uniref:RimJ/RimL family protein N-acetyltransferase n=1 Tax=Motilibacter rhizosphaerae TaxID=598652 RepID=A0A4Q7NBM1_9ACTN|nr:GNAT family N-acetyltransferase [Motilibacter rhizosphaerae]RZS80017.1 RimJ/RimL family protein N-acetyltransferase [Motilibacter rhizosphaerae]